MITNFRANNYNFRLQLQFKVHSLEHIPPEKLKKIDFPLKIRWRPKLNPLAHLYNQVGPTIRHSSTDPPIPRFVTIYVGQFQNRSNIQNALSNF